MLSIRNFSALLLSCLLSLPAAAAEVDEIDIKANFVRYSAGAKGKSVEQTQRAGKLNGRWYVNMSESPKEGAAKFRRAFGQQ